MTIVDLNKLIKWLENNEFSDVCWTDFEGKEHYVWAHESSMKTVLEFLEDFSEYLYQHPEHRNNFLYGG